MKKSELIVSLPEKSQIRLDKYIAEHNGILTRSQLKHRLVDVTVNGQSVKPSKPVENGDMVVLTYKDEEPPSVEPEPVTLEILYENDQAVVVDKPVGMVVHPAHGNFHNTLIQGILYRSRDMKQAFGQEQIRPGVVHRLDKDTSGIVVVAKNPRALEFLAKQFRSRKVEKTYLAVVKGTPVPRRGIIDKNVIRDKHHRKRFAVTETGGKSAVTHYRVLKSYGNYSFVALNPKTGRTHQLRVHMQSMSAPILGDPVYTRRDKRFPDETLHLHAYKLKIQLPGSDEIRTFRSPLPTRFKETLKSLSDR